MPARLRPDPQRPPPGPFRADFWRSPLRGPWLTSVLGAALLVAIPVIAATGFLSNDAYDPRLGGNSVGRHIGLLDFYLFPFPTHPSWLYAANQGLHVTLGLAAFPIVLAKLWSVIPRLFQWPPLRSPAHAVERASLALLVGGGLFEFVTGTINIQVYYPFHFFFTDAHYYGAWVFSAAFAAHVAVKLPTMVQALRTRERLLAPLRDDLRGTAAERAEIGPQRTPLSDLVPSAPAAPTMSRRALLAMVGAGSLLLGIQGAGQSIGGPLRRLALLTPRGDVPGGGPNSFQVNRSAAAAAIAQRDVGPAWRLALSGARDLELSRAQLEALPQHTHSLPIACVEGWSTTQTWSGVRVADLAGLVGMTGKLDMTTESIETNGIFTSATLGSNQVADERTLLALRVNGENLSLDHGYPARVIGPAIPGVHCTKWVQSIAFREAEDR